MPTYVFHLHDGPDVPLRTEVVEACDDQEARTLAELRLTLSTAFTQVEFDRDGIKVARLHREGQGPK